MFKSFCNNESGATAVEHAMLGTFLALGLVVAFQHLGQALSATFNNLAA